MGRSIVGIFDCGTDSFLKWRSPFSPPVYQSRYLYYHHDAKTSLCHCLLGRVPWFHNIVSQQGLEYHKYTDKYFFFFIFFFSFLSVSVPSSYHSSKQG